MAAKKKKIEDLLSGKAPTRGAGAKKPISETMKPKKKINALDAAIMKGKTLPSKNKMYPGDSDVGMKGFSKKPVIKVTNKKK